jgi:hypothetical protein
MAWLYKRALDDAIGLTTMLTMVLLDDEVYKTQKKALIDYVNTLPPQSTAHDIQMAVHTALCNLAAQWVKQGVPIGASGYLLKVKQPATQQPGKP